MVPQDFPLPSLNLHIEKESGGNYNDNVENIANFIKTTLITNGFDVWFKATEGDCYPPQDHITFFNKYISGKCGDFLILVTIFLQN